VLCHGAGPAPDRGVRGAGALPRRVVLRRWTVHTALDRSPVCFEVLRDITRIIAENMAPTSPETPSLISRVIGFPQLRTQLMALFQENALPVTVFEYYQNWKGFGAFLLWHIAGQPVGWPAVPRGRARVVREEMLALSGPHGFAVEALAIIEHEGKYHWKLALSQPDKTFFMVGVFDAIEGPDAFTMPPGGLSAQVCVHLSTAGGSGEQARTRSVFCVAVV